MVPQRASSEKRFGRETIVAAITAFLAGQEPAQLDRIRRDLERAIDDAGEAAVSELGRRLSEVGADWEYYPPDPLARRIHHLLADRMLEPESTVLGFEHLAAVVGRPVVMVANHLSYSDANLVEILLHRAGATELVTRLTVLAGPKVYSTVNRRFSSLCFGTIKVAQSSGLASEDAVMSARDAVRAARRAIEVAHTRLRRGDALLVFAEGTRSRSRGMQELLAGVARYLDVPGTCVLPVAITGTEALFPVGDDALHPVRVVAAIGRALEADALRRDADGDRQRMMDTIGRAIAALLPMEYRGIYAEGRNAP